MDAFHDLLRGGFGVHEYGEGIEFYWVHAKKADKISDMKPPHRIGNGFIKDVTLQIVKLLDRRRKQRRRMKDR